MMQSEEMVKRKKKSSNFGNNMVAGVDFLNGEAYTQTAIKIQYIK